MRTTGVAAVGVALVLTAGCSSGSPPEVPRPTATPLPVASLAGLKGVEHRQVGTSRCVIGDAGDPELVEVAVTRDDAGLTQVSWSGAEEVGGDDDHGWYLLATAVEGEAAFEVGVTSTADGVTAFVTDVGAGQTRYLTGEDVEDGDREEVVTVDDGQIVVSVDPADTPGLEGPIEWSAIATVDDQQTYSCFAP